MVAINSICTSRKYDLTDLEKKACAVIGDILEHNGFGDNEWDENAVAGVNEAGFYDTDLCDTTDIPWDDRNQLGGLITSLANKGVFAVENDFDYIEDIHYEVKRGHKKLIVKKAPRVLIWGIGKAVKELAK